MTHTPRPMQDADLPPLAQVWHDAWHRAHDAYVPQELIRLRTMQEFTDRLPALGETLRVIGPVGMPLGLCTIHEDELSQIFIAATAQGTGVAQALLADGEVRIAALGHKSAWLGVVPENQRAIMFYQKASWHQDGRNPIKLDTSHGIFMLETLIFRKNLTI